MRWRQIDQPRLKVMRKAAPPCQKRSILIFTTHKAASMFIYNIAERLSRLGGFRYYSINKGNLDEKDSHSWNSKGCCYAPLRSLLPSIDSSILGDYNIILHLRDPRDVLTSRFFWDTSSRFRSKGSFNPSDEHKRRWKEEGIDEYIFQKVRDNKSWAEIFLSSYEMYCRYLLGKPNVIFVKYEEMVADFKSWLGRIIIPFDIPNKEKAAEALARKNKNSFKVAAEDISAHKRRISPGDYKTKLKPETIVKLNLIFKDILQKLSYEI